MTPGDVCNPSGPPSPHWLSGDNNNHSTCSSGSCEGKVTCAKLLETGPAYRRPLIFSSSPLLSRRGASSAKPIFVAQRGEPLAWLVTRGLGGGEGGARRGPLGVCFQAAAGAWGLSCWAWRCQAAGGVGGELQRLLPVIRRVRGVRLPPSHSTSCPRDARLS